VGLLSCALGQSSDDQLRELSRSIKIGVRCDRPGALRIDFHTVEGGVLSAEGKVKINANTRQPETVVSWRQYLCDASFLVAVQTNHPGLVESLAEAVQQPHWPIYLGRKSCPPSRPVFAGQGNFGSLEEALASLPWRARYSGEEPIQPVRGVVECLPGQGTRRRDEVASASRRTFDPRYTLDISIQVAIQPEEEQCISPD
jgi:CRISPR system Cascade subunit CasD